MDLKSEDEIRSRAGNIALAWYVEKNGEFRGDSPLDYADMIGASHIAADESRLALHRWVDAGRRASLSWAEIGQLIGTTKQAAQQRFGGAADPPHGGPSAGETIVRRGATAFNEMQMLEAEGKAGRELVGTGALTLVLRQTDTAWEHSRVSAFRPSDVRARMERDGWIYVSSWYPFHYFKRPVGAPE
jgi:hypothetical protein